MLVGVSSHPWMVRWHITLIKGGVTGSETHVAQHPIQHCVLRVRLMFVRRFEIKRIEIKDSVMIHASMNEPSNLFSLCK